MARYWHDDRAGSMGHTTPEAAVPPGRNVRLAWAPGKRGLFIDPVPGSVVIATRSMRTAGAGWLARASGAVLALPQIWVSARWISCLGPVSIERQVTGVAGHRRL